MYSDDKSAMWFIPISGGNHIAIGDHDSLIFSESGIAHSESNGIHELIASFRTAQSFDDQSYCGLKQGCNWLMVSFLCQQLRLGQVRLSIMTLRFNRWNCTPIEYFLSSESSYVMAEENLSIHVDIGFENGADDEKPFPGEYEVTLTKNGELISKTTAYEGSEWVVETSTPFTSGNITYEVTLTPLAGGGISGSEKINRTLIIDPLAPVVTGSNIRYFDHLQSSTNQQNLNKISDQPSLPTDVTLMLWTEWANDYDGNGWPSEGEYIPRPMYNPTNLDLNYGVYQAFVDDSPAYPGEKVAGYVTGVDPSGHVLLGGGSETLDDHLFMYQIMSDGNPLVDSDGLNGLAKRGLGCIQTKNTN